MGRQGRRRARAHRSGRPGRLPRRPRRQGARRLRARARAPRPRRKAAPPPRPRRHPLGPEVGLACRPGRRRPTRRRRSRPGGRGDARLDRGQRRRDPGEGPRDGPDGARGRAEDGRRHLPPRHLAQPRPAAPHPCRHRQHGAGRGRQVAVHGQREALRNQDADRGHLPQRARAWALPPRIRHREDPCRRALRDRGRLARGDRRILDPPRRDRGGDGGTRHGIPLRQSAPRRAGGAGEPRGEA